MIANDLILVGWCDLILHDVIDEICVMWLIMIWWSIWRDCSWSAWLFQKDVAVSDLNDSMVIDGVLNFKIYSFGQVLLRRIWSTAHKIMLIDLFINAYVIFMTKPVKNMRHNCISIQIWPGFNPNKIICWFVCLFITNFFFLYKFYEWIVICFADCLISFVLIHGNCLFTCRFCLSHS